MTSPIKYKTVTIAYEGKSVTYQVQDTEILGVEMNYGNKTLFDFNKINGDKTTYNAKNEKEWNEISAFLKKADATGDKNKPDGKIDYQDVNYYETPLDFYQGYYRKSPKPGELGGASGDAGACIYSVPKEEGGPSFNISM